MCKDYKLNLIHSFCFGSLLIAEVTQDIAVFHIFYEDSQDYKLFFIVLGNESTFFFRFNFQTPPVHIQTTHKWKKKNLPHRDWLPQRVLSIFEGQIYRWCASNSQQLVVWSRNYFFLHVRKSDGTNGSTQRCSSLCYPHEVCTNLHFILMYMLMLKIYPETNKKTSTS